METEPRTNDDEAIPDIEAGLRMLAVKTVLEDELPCFLALPTLGNLTRLRYLIAEYAEAWAKLDPERVDVLRAYYTAAPNESQQKPSLTME